MPYDNNMGMPKRTPSKPSNGKKTIMPVVPGKGKTLPMPTKPGNGNMRIQPVAPAKGKAMPLPMPKKPGTAKGK